MPSKTSSLDVLLSARAIDSAVARMARAIFELHPQGADLVLIGIQTGGVHLARQLAARLGAAWKRALPVGQLDVAMHRDDLDQRLAPQVHPTAIPFDVTGKQVILVDDVLFTGRTTRAALGALNDLGRPKRVQLAVLIDRGHRELPIQADFVGRTVVTAPADRVNVELIDNDGVSQVTIQRAPPGRGGRA